MLLSCLKVSLFFAVLSASVRFAMGAENGEVAKMAFAAFTYSGLGYYLGKSGLL